MNANVQNKNTHTVKTYVCVELLTHAHTPHTYTRTCIAL